MLGISPRQAAPACRRLGAAAARAPGRRARARVPPAERASAPRPSAACPCCCPRHCQQPRPTLFPAQHPPLLPPRLPCRPEGGRARRAAAPKQAPRGAWCPATVPPAWPAARAQPVIRLGVFWLMRLAGAPARVAARAAAGGAAPERAPSTGASAAALPGAHPSCGGHLRWLSATASRSEAAEAHHTAAKAPTPADGSALRVARQHPVPTCEALERAPCAHAASGCAAPRLGRPIGPLRSSWMLPGTPLPGGDCGYCSHTLCQQG